MFELRSKWRLSLRHRGKIDSGCAADMRGFRYSDRMTDAAFQRCIHADCGTTAPLDAAAFQCPACGSLMDVAYDWDRVRPPRDLREFEAKWSRRSEPLEFSGVWRFRELFPFARDDQILTIGEGQTLTQPSDGVATFAGMNPGRLYLHYEGM